MSWGYLYLIEDTCSHLLKIGQTARHPEQRLRELQTGNPHPLRLCRVYRMQAVAQVEAALHRQFAHRRLQGEWFRVSVAEVDLAIQPWLSSQATQVPSSQSGAETTVLPRFDWEDLAVGAGFALAAWVLLESALDQPE
jgi:hypothetical protein